MPRSFPPSSVKRHSGRRTSGDRGSRDRDVRHRPFAGEEQDRQTQTKWKTMRQHFIAMSGEFVGTLLFLWFSFAIAQTAAMTGGAAGTSSEIVLTSLGFGFSLLVTVWAFYRISGGLFNPAVRSTSSSPLLFSSPAPRPGPSPSFRPNPLNLDENANQLRLLQVTLAMVITGNLPWFRGLLLLPAELLGGIVAAALVRCMFPGPLSVNTTLSNGTTPAQGVFIEMFLTALLVFTILMLAAEKHYATFMAPVGIGLALFVAMMAGVHWTGASLNPARSFGPAVATPYFPSYHYIYWFGPIMGSLLAAGYYKFVKYLNYEEANPGQDAIDEKEKEKQDQRAASDA
ncbi:hypothetical protein LTR07_001843 [Exophiala xenobiotica]|nr:hypothetical protein LTR41_002235 [Exophiala xenobiotica]KAK5425202.1 hypothetical protein LTR90_000794 [Exophiala xenobiotica]KAK5501099.1 hypothetical protein LTR26_000792 [Exophiala xenobiotica]KAK5506240.1 hypothetical protein LTR83_000793 [Exophiala xenobiotica]KAK5522944.1 hypothetical protein LTR21_000792 [Exophiala xenobiotica]